MIGYILVARIQAIYGKAGFLRLQSFSDFPDRFFKLKTVFVEFYGSFKQLKVEKVKYDGDTILLKFEKFEDEKGLEMLVGKDIYIEEKDAVKLPDNTYFVHDLIESSVFLNEKFLGVIKDVMLLPANDVYVVENEGKETLIPASNNLLSHLMPTKRF
ncbi:MAG: 16S rRNA processing protein RimM [Ignavibacteriales bacterium]|nr:16S rRNA processing protein RimM [Ignavibacteriales bacterium]